ncbi:hypothetical protein EDD11_002949 [Mortierella claussenii]|nr:hypothetical protein EDD11_002949 [Mortierella claussenii]
MTTSPLPSPFLTLPSLDQQSLSPPSSPISPQISPLLSSVSISSSLPHPTENTPVPALSNRQQPSLNPNCPAEQQLQSSFEQHQRHQQEMRHQLLQKDHPLHIPDAESAKLHQQQLVTQLEYYRQLQIMHCQRVRDIELLHLQQQHHQPQSFHVIKRFQLAQRMLQMQKLYYAHQVQKIQYLQKISRLQESPPSTPSGNGVADQMHTTAVATDTQVHKAVSEKDMATLEIDTNTMHIPVRPASRPRLDLQELFGTIGNAALPHMFNTAPFSPSPSSSTRQNHVPELARIVLPSPDQIRKLRHQRLKHQARLRQAAAARAAEKQTIPTPSQQGDDSWHQPCATITTNKQKQQQVTPLPVRALPGLSTPPASPTTTLFEPLGGATSETQLAKQVQAAVWTSSTTSIAQRSTADITYRRQLRHSMALQQYMIQDHTHRYRVFQAFCLLQRAREAQAMDEAQSRKHKQMQTLAWVEALRQSKELEIPQ